MCGFESRSWHQSLLNGHATGGVSEWSMVQPWKGCVGASPPGVRIPPPPPVFPGGSYFAAPNPIIPRGNFKTPEYISRQVRQVREVLFLGSLCELGGLCVRLKRGFCNWLPRISQSAARSLRFCVPALERLRPMPITKESNGHWAGIQWALDRHPMGIEFRSNGH